MAYSPAPILYMGMLYIMVGILSSFVSLGQLHEPILLIMGVVLLTLAYSMYESGVVSMEEIEQPFTIKRASTLIIFVSHILFSANIFYYLLYSKSTLFQMEFAIPIGLILIALSSLESARTRKLRRWK